MNDPIEKTLRLVEKDLTITEVSYETFQKKKTLIVGAVFSSAPHTCRNCGSTVVDGSEKVIAVKNGKRGAIIRFEQYNHIPLVMCLKKQCHTCKNCRVHWMARSYFAQPRYSTVSHVRYKIVSLSIEKVSPSLIAKNCQVFLTTVTRMLKGFKNYLPKQSKRILPRVLMVDEFRSYASIKDKMSSTCADGEAGQLVDVLFTCKLPRLASYFLGCANPEEVKFLVTDMNVAYFQPIKCILSNAKVAIDRSHTIKHMNRVFSGLHIREMNELRKIGQKSQAEKLKKS